MNHLHSIIKFYNKIFIYALLISGVLITSKYALQQINCTCLRVFVALETIDNSKCQLIHLLLDIDFD